MGKRGERRRRGQVDLEVQLLAGLKQRRGELQELLELASDHWGFEDPIYRFYRRSFKVYALQALTQRIVRELGALLPTRPLDLSFLQILQQGTGREFRLEHNERWTEVTRPILEAFFHARFFLEMAVRYRDLTSPPELLPSGYAALLCLYGLR